MMDTAKVINGFRDEFRFLSNFAPCRVEFEGLVFPSVEHAYQAAKADNLTERLRFASELITAGQAKKMGMCLKLRPDWETVKIDVMRQLLRKKFADPFYSSLLAATGSAQLIEGNTWGDTFWGVVGSAGQNWLGKILMEVRAEL